MTELALSAEALEQQRLWGTDPAAWAEVAEPLTRPVFSAVLNAAGVGPGTRLLDAGCGSGLALQLATELGAVVAGLDVSPGLLEVARRRLPQADLRLGDLQYLPYPDQTFDVVIGVNTFQFAADPQASLREAARVIRAGGRVAVAMFAEPERCESTVIHVALSALSPPQRQAAHQPYSLSADGNLEQALVSAGLAVERDAEVELDWAYADAHTALRGLLSSAGGTRALQDNDRPVVEDAVLAALLPFTRNDGSIVMHNVFRYVIARFP